MTQAHSANYRAPLFGEERGARIAPFGSPGTQGLAPVARFPKPAHWPAATAVVTARRGLRAGWMPDALEQLSQVDEEAAAEGYPPLTDVTRKSVERLLFALGNSPIAPAVYPSMDGEIAIYFKSPSAAAALLILVNDSGGAGCYASINGENRLTRYEDTSVLPDKFLKEQIRTLGGTSLWQQNLV